MNPGRDVSGSLYLVNEAWSDVKWKLPSSVQLFVTPWTWYGPWNSPGQNTGMGSPSLLQGIFPTQGLNRGLLHCRQILHQLSHKGSPRILEWVAYPFSSGSSCPRNRTGISCIAGGFFTNWGGLCFNVNICFVVLLLQFLKVERSPSFFNTAFGNYLFSSFFLLPLFVSSEARGLFWLLFTVCLVSGLVPGTCAFSSCWLNK